MRTSLGEWPYLDEDERRQLGELITHTFALEEIDTAIDLFRDKRDGVFKVAIKP